MDFAVSTRQGMASKNVAEILEELDSNGDGRLSLEEHLAPYKKPLAQDEDSDCRMAVGNLRVPAATRTWRVDRVMCLVPYLP